MKAGEDECMPESNGMLVPDLPSLFTPIGEMNTMGWQKLTLGDNTRAEIFGVHWAGTVRDNLRNSGIVGPGILDLCCQRGPWGWCSPYGLGNINGTSPVRSWPSHSLLCGLRAVAFPGWSFYSAMINVNNEWNTILECELQCTVHQISLRIRKWYWTD